MASFGGALRRVEIVVFGRWHWYAPGGGCPGANSSAEGYPFWVVLEAPRRLARRTGGFGGESGGWWRFGYGVAAPLRGSCSPVAGRNRADPGWPQRL